jgi:PEP-CTERM motif
MRGLLSIGAITIAAAASAASAHAAKYVDVDNLVMPQQWEYAYSLGAQDLVFQGEVYGREVMQTWTSNSSGKLSSIDLYGAALSTRTTDGIDWNYDSVFSVTLSILGGSESIYFPGQVELGALTLSSSQITPHGVTAIDLSALDLTVQQGEVLTWKLSVEACPPGQMTCINQWITTYWFDTGETSSGYAAGHAFYRQDGYYVSHGDIDGNFRIWMTSGVPEPATWAMMTLGFGGVGAMIRGRRRTVGTAV